jgi:hypothetical protein
MLARGNADPCQRYECQQQQDHPLYRCPWLSTGDSCWTPLPRLNQVVVLFTHDLEEESLYFDKVDVKVVSLTSSAGAQHINVMNPSKDFLHHKRSSLIKLAFRSQHFASKFGLLRAGCKANESIPSITNLHLGM